MTELQNNSIIVISISTKITINMSSRVKIAIYLKGFAPMPPAPFMSSAVVWRRSGFEAKWSGI